MEIKDFVRPGTYIVIELDDEVEYFLDSVAVGEVEKGSEIIPLVRLYDHAVCLVKKDTIVAILQSRGVTDYIETARFFVGCIAQEAILSTEDFSIVINQLRDFGFAEEKIYEPVSGWTAPEPYERESGPNLQTKLIVFSGIRPRSEIVRLKHECERIERETAVEGKRRFNLNPGFVDSGGMYLASHKPSPLRVSYGDVWLEKQMQVQNNALVSMVNVFTEYSHPARLDALNSLYKTI